MTMKRGQAGGYIGVARVLLHAEVAHPVSASAVKLAVSLTALARHAQTSPVMLEFERLTIFQHYSKTLVKFLPLSPSAKTFAKWHQH